MKKLFTIIAAAFVFTTAAFAKGSYAGDVQLHFGFATDTFTPTNIIVAEKPTSALFTADLSTTHLWGNSQFIKFGFTVDFDLGLGGTITASNSSVGENHIAFKSNMLIGPCIGIKLGNVVRFDITPGISVIECDFFTNYDETASKLTLIGATAIGPALEVKAKFAPNAVFSPIIGYRFSANFTTFLLSGTYTVKTDTGSGTIDVPAKSMMIFTNSFYLGFGWNW